MPKPFSAILSVVTAPLNAATSGRLEAKLREQDGEDGGPSREGILAEIVIDVHKAPPIEPTAKCFIRWSAGCTPEASMSGVGPSWCSLRGLGPCPLRPLTDVTAVGCQIVDVWSKGNSAKRKEQVSTKQMPHTCGQLWKCVTHSTAVSRCTWPTGKWPGRSRASLCSI